MRYNTSLYASQYHRAATESPVERQAHQNGVVRRIMIIVAALTDLRERQTPIKPSRPATSSAHLKVAPRCTRLPAPFQGLRAQPFTPTRTPKLARNGDTLKLGRGIQVKRNRNKPGKPPSRSLRKYKDRCGGRLLPRPLQKPQVLLAAPVRRLWDLAFEF